MHSCISVRKTRAKYTVRVYIELSLYAEFLDTERISQQVEPCAWTRLVELLFGVSCIKGNKGVKQLISDNSFGKHFFFAVTDRRVGTANTVPRPMVIPPWAATLAASTVVGLDADWISK